MRNSPESGSGLYAAALRQINLNGAAVAVLPAGRGGFHQYCGANGFLISKKFY
jgi:hypothetical protein